jgi:hypothetical protein
MPEPLSPEGYAEQGSGLCPVCRGWNIGGSTITIDQQFAIQKVGCNDCEASWEDWYKLQGYTELDVPC